MIRITGGQYRGRQIQAPPGDAVRPTTGKVRESIFSMLQSRQPLSGLRVLDGYAGSGLMGLEALSRGAAYVLAIENNPHHADLIRANYTALNIPSSQYKLMVSEITTALSTPNPDAPYDVVYLDPPYALGFPQAAIDLLQTHDWVNPLGGIIIVEHTQNLESLSGYHRRDYGDTSVSWCQLGC